MKLDKNIPVCVLLSQKWDRVQVIFNDYDMLNAVCIYSYY
jgi:hypothetical protein